jgi:hypothetical protein
MIWTYHSERSCWYIVITLYSWSSSTSRWWCTNRFNVEQWWRIERQPSSIRGSLVPSQSKDSSSRPWKDSKNRTKGMSSQSSKYRRDLVNSNEVRCSVSEESASIVSRSFVPRQLRNFKVRSGLRFRACANSAFALKNDTAERDAIFRPGKTTFASSKGSSKQCRAKLLPGYHVELTGQISERSSSIVS